MKNDKIDRKLLNEISHTLISNNTTLSVAESVTAGNIQAVISLAENASSFFQGGITVYNAGQKYRHLNVEPLHATQCNSVSEIVAKQMALNVCSLFCSNYGIGITGYASPVPELDIKDLFAYVAVAKDQKIIGELKLTTDASAPQEAQLSYTDQALGFLLNLLKK